MNLAGHRVRRLFGNYFEPCVLSGRPSTQLIKPNILNNTSTLTILYGGGGGGNRMGTFKSDMDFLFVVLFCCCCIKCK